ncbi:unnamed protein product [Auanema sp. JU1783]|nr:unnamed protein product [Auanema sp. JU1783]
MQQEEFNCILIVFSGIVVIAALFLLCLGCCKYRLHKRKGNNRLQIPHVKITKAPPLSLDSADIDFIDSRNTNLVSSTVRVSSVHDAPPNV